MARAGARTPPAHQPEAATEASSVSKLQVWHQHCAKCGHPATLGMMLTDGAGTGPWLCLPSSFFGRAGCRPRPHP